MSDEPTDDGLESLRFPVGRFELRVPEPAEVPAAIDRIAACPARLRAAVEGLDETQLATPYRPDGWTLRQVVHHLPDSHFNSLCRFKLALTEDRPTIRPYFEDRWARLPDAAGPVEVALDLLDALHEKWVLLLRSLGPEEHARTFLHPEMDAEIRLDTNMLLYAWHGEHHVAHVTALAQRSGW
jgi:hypothetical protein